MSVDTRSDRTEHLVGAGEALFCVGALFACTMGPVFRVSLEFGGQVVNYVDDPLVIALFALIYVVAALLASRGTRSVDWRPVLAALMLCSMMLLSSIWSVDRHLSATRAVLALCTLALPWYLARRWQASEVAAFAWAATSLGIIASLIALAVGDEFARDQRGDWAGIYFNRNSLGAVAGVAALLSLWMLATGGPFRLAGVARRASRVLGAITAPLALLALGGSGSKTSVLALAAAVAVWAAVLLVRGVAPVERRRSWLWVVGALGVALMGWLFRPLSSALGSDPTLQGRTELWGYIWRRFLSRPFTGDGWLATYTTDDYWYWGRDHLSLNVQIGHNGILEVAVGTGIVGLALLLVVMYFAASYAIRTAAIAGPPKVLGLLVVAYFVVANSAETLVGAHHLLWVLFLAVAAFRWSPETAVDPYCPEIVEEKP